MDKAPNMKKAVKYEVDLFDITNNEVIKIYRANVKKLAK